MTGPDVDRFLADAEQAWPSDALASIVATIRSAGPFNEAIKWGHPYFSLNDRAVLKLYVARTWINVFYYRGAELKDPDVLLTGDGPSGMRRLRIYRDEDVPLGLIDRLTRAAVALEIASEPNQDCTVNRC
ncbi:DUF1801 domain-containing protein [uncultured Microbacterium sp.]|uniref:DUF1801 domain-containing protein n=1 Tax=uncultured Microbacterium sp. TaxID=191216 RepID=UPI0025ECBEF3|nr:DUF1801 domain-containing protein [uncultured Microbacterium sp.]